MTQAAQLIDDLKHGRLRADCTVALRASSLAGADLSGLDLSGADLSGADLSGAMLFRATLCGANLRSARLKGAELSGADLSSAMLSEVDAEGAGFGGANLADASLLNAKLQGCTFSKANLEGTDLRCAILRDSRLREASLIGTDFTGADLRGADLSLSCVRRAIFNNADLRRSRLRQLDGYRKASWMGVDLRDINLAGAYDLLRFVKDENYLFEFRQRSRVHGVLYYVWAITSDCGRSLGLWCAWIGVVTVLYAVLYTAVDVNYGDHRTWLSPLYFSAVTMSTLGYGDVVPASPQAQLLAIMQVGTGYVMLGILLSLFTNKIARRAE